MDISIVIPAYNEEENISILADEIDLVMSSTPVNWECIWVDDGSRDGTWSKIKNLNSPHKGVQLKRNLGQSSAIMAGIDTANSDIIVTLDSDLQNDPGDIPKLVDLLTDDIDVVCGVRVDRQDRLYSRKLPSKIANWLARRVTGVQVSDLGCTLRVFRKHLTEEARLFGEMHRIIVIYFHLLGASIIETPVKHRARLYGESKYGLERFFKFFADILLAKVMNILRSKPLYFFGLLSIVVSGISSSLLSTALLLRISGIRDYLDTSLVGASVVLFAAALILVSIGLITEILIREISTIKFAKQNKLLKEFK